MRNLGDRPERLRQDVGQKRHTADQELQLIGHLPNLHVQRKKSASSAGSSRYLLEGEGLAAVDSDAAASCHQGRRPVRDPHSHRPLRTRKNHLSTKCLKCARSQLRDNNLVENSNLPVRRGKREIQRFKSQGQAQRFISIHSANNYKFNMLCYLSSRQAIRTFQCASMAEWNVATSAAA